MSSVFREFGAGLTAFEAPLDARLAFIRRTYLHLTGAVLAFAGLCAAFYAAHVGERVAEFLSGLRFGIWLVLGAFLLVAWMARGLARSTNSPALQYLGLGGYVGALALIFSPIITMAANHYPGVLPTAAGLTVLAFGGLSAYVLTTKKDFSFLGPILGIAGLVALGTIGASWIFDWNLGIWFSAGMIIVMIGSILYDTSKIVHQYRTDQHVAAALELFASVAILFMYILRLLMQLQRR